MKQKPIRRAPRPDLRERRRRMLVRDRKLRPMVAVTFVLCCLMLFLYHSGKLPLRGGLALLVVCCIANAAVFIPFRINLHCPKCGMYIQSRLNPWVWVMCWPLKPEYCYFCHTPLFTDEVPTEEEGERSEARSL